MIKISVPGKIHLLGEHAVVYGKPALLSAINLRILITVIAEQETSPRRLIARSQSDEAISKEKILNPVQDDSGEILSDLSKNKKIVELRKVLENTFKEKLGVKNIPEYQISIKSELPIGAGLGSSAAISVGITAALFSLLKMDWDLNQIYHIAYEGEKLFHGNPSGADVAAVLYGGFLWFRKEAEFLKLFSPLPVENSEKIQKFFLINSGTPVESTKEMVELVKAKWQGSRVKTSPVILRSQATKDLEFKDILNQQEILTKVLAHALKDENETMLMEAIKEGEKNLEKLGVVGKKAQKIVREIEKTGGVAKITGAGGIKEGSGMILVYSNDVKLITEIAEKNSWELMAIKLDGGGLK